MATICPLHKIKQSRALEGNDQVIKQNFSWSNLDQSANLYEWQVEIGPCFRSSLFLLNTSDQLVWMQGSGLPSEETNCPTTEDAPLLFSWKLTSETMMSSSSTEPQLVHTASPRPASYSISAPPQLEHTVDFDMAAVADGERELLCFVL